MTSIKTTLAAAATALTMALAFAPAAEARPGHGGGHFGGGHHGGGHHVNPPVGIGAHHLQPRPHHVGPHVQCFRAPCPHSGPGSRPFPPQGCRAAWCSPNYYGHGHRYGYGVIAAAVGSECYTVRKRVWDDYSGRFVVARRTVCE